MRERELEIRSRKQQSMHTSEISKVIGVLRLRFDPLAAAQPPLRMTDEN
jgi:hypothetical protein